MLGGGGGEAVADDEGDVCGNRGGAGGERLIFGEAAAEVGAQEVGAAVGAGALDEEAGQVRGGEVGGEGLGVEFGVDGVAGGGVGGLERQVGGGWQAVARPAEAFFPVMVTAP